MTEEHCMPFIKNQLSLVAEDSYTCNNFLRGSALDLGSCDLPKMLFTWAAICRQMVVALADVMEEHLITGTEVVLEGLFQPLSECAWT